MSAFAWEYSPILHSWRAKLRRERGRWSPVRPIWPAGARLVHRRTSCSTKRLFPARVPAERDGASVAVLRKSPSSSGRDSCSAEGVRAAVISGQGFTISSRWMFSPELESGEAVSVLDEWSLPPMDLWMIYASGRLTTTKARAFAKWFEGLFADRRLR
jgi:DNA-binding transcriptional LysR family regulator